MRINTIPSVHSTTKCRQVNEQVSLISFNNAQIEYCGTCDKVLRMYNIKNEIVFVDKVKP